ncbi:MAG: hypothetical protein IT373_20305 [Polyangiaceae bacterium]|nr:hypothetical protein [Polyangiaceae bacterium]
MKPLHRALLAACSVVLGSMACAASPPNPTVPPPGPAVPPGPAPALDARRGAAVAPDPCAGAPTELPGDYAVTYCPRLRAPRALHVAPETRLVPGPAWQGHHLR